MRKDRSIRICVWVIWILAGFILAISAGFMAGSRSFNLRDFYDAGEVFYLTPTKKHTPKLEGVSYDEKTKIFQINENKASIKFSGGKKDVQYYYLYLDMTDMNTDGVLAKFKFYNTDNNKVGEYENVFGQGLNIYQLPVTGEFSRMTLFVKEQSGVSFGIKGIELRQQLVDFSKKRCAAAFGAILLLYIAVSMILLKKGVSFTVIKETLSKVSELLQYLFIKQQKPAEYLVKRVGRQNCRICRIILLTGLSVYMMLVNDLGLYTHEKYYKYHMLFASIVLVLVAWLLYEGELQFQKWKSQITISWYFLWILVCICDGWMGSLYLCTGYIMLLVFGNVFFFWSNQKSDKKNFIYEMLASSGMAIILWIAWIILKGIITGNTNAGVLPDIGDIWMSLKCSIGNFNLIGHSEMLNNGGIEISPYSGILQMAYQYGILILIPYMNLLIHAFQKGWRIRKKFPVCIEIEIVFTLLVLFCQLEQPFLSPVWLVYYLHLGYYFSEG